MTLSNYIWFLCDSHIFCAANRCKKLYLWMGSKVKGDQIWNYFKWLKLQSQPVGHGHTCKSVHVDLFVRPTDKGSKVKEVPNLKFQIAKITMSTCWAPVATCIVKLMGQFLPNNANLDNSCRSNTLNLGQISSRNLYIRLVFLLTRNPPTIPQLLQII